MEHHRAFWRLAASIGVDVAAVIANRDVDRRARGCEPCDRAAHAEPDNTDLAGALHVIDRGSDIVHGIVPIEPAFQRPAFAHAGFVEAQNDPGFEAVEQGRGGGVVALLGEIIDGFADIVVDAEYFLDDHHAALRFARGLGCVGVQRMTVGCGER